MVEVGADALTEVEVVALKRCTVAAHCSIQNLYCGSAWWHPGNRDWLERWHYTRSAASLTDWGND